MPSFVDPELKRFIQDNSLEKRRAVARQLLAKYPDRVPIIIGRGELLNTKAATKFKFVCPGDITFGKFILEVRRHIPSLDPSSALYFFTSTNTIPAVAAVMSTLYTKHKADDGFLYITYSCESTFG